MAQYLKDEIQARIHDAALALFALKGFGRATVAEIARRAGISTGNVYRYYPGKQELFDAVVPAGLASDLRHLVHRRVRALAGVADARTLGPATPYRQLSEELLAFAIEHRLEVIILLGRAEGTRHEAFAGALRRELEALAVAHFGREPSSVSADASMKFTLDRVYRNWIQTLVAILEAFEDERGIRKAVERFSAYHLAGLKGLFEERAGTR